MGIHLVLMNVNTRMYTNDGFVTSMNVYDSENATKWVCVCTMCIGQTHSKCELYVLLTG